ncbi:MAG: hypothetical protein ACFCUU_15625 [Cyclobacteriaceae bacterium]
MYTIKSKCIECGVEMSGRADKKFCSDHCRANYNNKLNGEVNNYMRRVNRILRKNRRILTDLNPKGKNTVHRERLFDKGFNFGFFTNTYVTQKGRVYYFCYEQGYVDNGDGFITIVQRIEAFE